MLAQRFKLTGDPQLKNPDQVAARILEQSINTILPNYDVSGTDPFREFVSRVLRVDLSRLPPKATHYDFVIETLFRSRMAILREVCLATSWRTVISCFCQLISSHRKTWSSAYSLIS